MENGRTLKVRFFDGIAVVQRKVEQYAHEWSKIANVKLEFGDGPNADIRISFGARLLVLYRHRCVEHQSGQATMNYGWLTPGTDDTGVLACGHPRVRPRPRLHPRAFEPGGRHPLGQGGGLPLLPGLQTTGRADGDFNLFQRYSQNITQFTEFDRESIMLYPIPNDLTIGDFEVGWNTVLSPATRSSSAYSIR